MSLRVRTVTVRVSTDTEVVPQSRSKTSRGDPFVLPTPAQRAPSR